MSKRCVSLRDHSQPKSNLAAKILRGIAWSMHLLYMYLCCYTYSNKRSSRFVAHKLPVSRSNRWSYAEDEMDFMRRCKYLCSGAQTSFYRWSLSFPCSGVSRLFLLDSKASFLFVPVTLKSLTYNNNTFHIAWGLLWMNTCVEGFTVRTTNYFWLRALSLHACLLHGGRQQRSTQ